MGLDPTQADTKRPPGFEAMLLDHIGDQLTATDMEGRITYVNEAQCRTLRRTREELLGLTVHDYGEDPGRGATQDEIIRITREQGEWRGEVINYAADGSEIVIESHTWVVYDPGGNPIGMCGIGRDITRRKQAEVALAEQKHLLQVILDALPDAVAVLRPDHSVVSCNRAGEELPGRPMREAAGLKCYELLGRDGLCEECPVDMAIATGAMQSVQLHIAELGLWFEERCVPVVDEQGDVSLIVIQLRDVTRRRRAQQERERLARAVEQTAETVLITDAAGTITYVNPAFEKTTGYSRSEAIGQNPRILRSGEHDAAFYEQMWGALAAGEVWAGRITNRKKDGTLYLEDAVISPMRSTEGEIVSYVAVKRDITEHVRLAEHVQQAQRVESIGRLAAGVAHDFNNMLSPILGYADLLLTQFPASDPRRNQLEQIKAAAESSRDLVGQLLAFSRKQVLSVEPLDLGRVVMGLVKMLERTIGEGITVKVDVRGGPAAVEADPSQIELVLMNLAVNARDAMPDGGTLTVTVEDAVVAEQTHPAHPDLEPGHYVLLAVTDTGVGMDEQTRAHIFEPFFTTKPRGQGTGLGLATVHGIVNQHGGRVYAESRPGAGTTFSIYLPTCTDRPLDAASEPVQAVDIPTGAETVMVVEDNHMVRELARTVLQELGYAPVTASSGEDCLRIVEHLEPEIDLLLTDVVMPGISGIELHERLAARYPRMRVVYMSGHADSIIGKQGVTGENVRLMQKPFSVRALAENIRAALDGEG
jgi:PAS domain S-box-containing protein